MIVAPDYPSDLPEEMECIVEVLVGDGARKIIKVYKYGSPMDIYYRTVFNNTYYSAWCKDTATVLS